MTTTSLMAPKPGTVSWTWINCSRNLQAVVVDTRSSINLVSKTSRDLDRSISDQWALTDSAQGNEGGREQDHGQTGYTPTGARNDVENIVAAITMVTAVLMMRMRTILSSLTGMTGVR